MATLEKDGLVRKGSMFVYNKASENTDAYILIQCGSSNLIVDIGRPGLNDFLFINCQQTGTSSTVKSCTILQISRIVNVDAARFMKNTNGRYLLELHLTNSTYVSYVGLLCLSGSIFNVETLSEPVPDDEIEYSVNALIKNFDRL